MTKTMKRIALASRPEGAASTEHFRLEDIDIPALQDGQVLIRNDYLSLDPYMRGRMSDAPSYAPPVEVGETMVGGTVGRILESRDPSLVEGDLVLAMTGWADHGVANAAEVRKLPDGIAPETALGVLGMPGYTGWWGLTAIGQPKAGETVVVAAATGPVGSMVGQVAKLRGARAIGIAGGPEKCAEAKELYGFDEVLDHKAYPDAKALREALKAACPDGIDVYFENVGGKVLEAVLPLMNHHGRIPVCGTIAWYEGDDGSRAKLPSLWRQILVRRLTVKGFIIMENWDQYGDFLNEIAPMVMDGSIKWKHDTAEGLASAPETFLRMLKGGNRGKQVVKIS